MGEKDTEKNYNILQSIVAGVSASTTHAVQIALGTNTEVVIWRDGKVVEISPHDPSISIDVSVKTSSDDLSAGPQVPYKPGE